MGNNVYNESSEYLAEEHTSTTFLGCPGIVQAVKEALKQTTLGG